MADRPDGKGVNADRVVFTRPAAERISKAVLVVEAGSRDALPMSFGVRLDNSASPLKLATVTGQWATGATASLTFYANSNTVSVQNLHMPVEVAAGASAECVIGKAGGTWTLLAVNFGKLKAFSADKVQLLGHNADGYAQWYSITTCSTATAS